MTDLWRKEIEQGPIRPPSESRSLFLRIIRNCPWNRCTFCPVYKNQAFSCRKKSEILDEINLIRHMADYILERTSSRDESVVLSVAEALAIAQTPGASDSFRSVVHWRHSTSRNVFLQDADPLVMKTHDLKDILSTLKRNFPTVGRITAYSRSATTARLAGEKLRLLKNAGLDRIHTGLESGDAETLTETCKGMTPDMHVRGGLAVKEAGMELSLYYMPGLGGRSLWRRHAIESARIVSQIKPDFIRLRSLAVIPGTPLWTNWRNARFTPLTEDEIVKEIRLFLESLDSPGTRIESDHILNLFEDLQGVIPDDIPSMLAHLDRFLDLPVDERRLFILGKRIGAVRSILDLSNLVKRRHIESFREEMAASGFRFDEMIEEIKNRML